MLHKAPYLVGELETKRQFSGASYSLFHRLRLGCTHSASRPPHPIDAATICYRQTSNVPSAYTGLLRTLSEFDRSCKAMLERPVSRVVFNNVIGKLKQSGLFCSELPYRLKKPTRSAPLRHLSKHINLEGKLQESGTSDESTPRGSDGPVLVISNTRLMNSCVSTVPSSSFFLKIFIEARGDLKYGL
jgi:hypothetical protein